MYKRNLTEKGYSVYLLRASTLLNIGKCLKTKKVFGFQFKGDKDN